MIEACGKATDTKLKITTFLTFTGLARVTKHLSHMIDGIAQMADGNKIYSVNTSEFTNLRLVCFCS